MSEEYTIRKLESTEFDLLIPLMKDCFGLSVNIQYFMWKFLNNPHGEFIGFVAEAKNKEIAAYYGVIPEEFVFENTIKIIYQSCDTMTHSKHRRKGLFQKLALHCYNYLKTENKLFVYGFGGGQSTPGFLKFGWKHIFNFKYYFYPKQFTFFNFHNSIYDIEEVLDYYKIENAIKNSNKYSNIHSNKTVKSFEWRIQNPLYQYKVISFKNNEGEYDSYLCYYIVDNKIFIFDFYFKNQKSGQILMSYLKFTLKNSKQIGIVSFCQENSTYSKTLKSYNFISNPFSKGPLNTQTPFIIFSDEITMEKYIDSNKWLVNSFDHDAL